MVQAGTIIRNNTGQIMWKDGTTILHIGNETILAAINQELTNQNKTAPMTNFICQSLPFEDATSDKEENSDIIIKNSQVYAAVKPKDNKKLKKKGHVDPKKRMIFDGVDISPRCEPVKEEPKEATIPPNNPHIVMPPPMVYDTPAQPFNIGDDDVFMEDVTHEPSKVPKLKKKIIAQDSSRWSSINSQTRAF